MFRHDVLHNVTPLRHWSV